MKIKLKSESKVNTEDATTINEQAEQIKRMQNIILVLREDYKTLNIKTEELILANEYIRRRLPEICNIIMDEFISGKECMSLYQKKKGGDTSMAKAAPAPKGKGKGGGKPVKGGKGGTKAC